MNKGPKQTGGSAGKNVHKRKKLHNSLKETQILKHQMTKLKIQNETQNWVKYDFSYNVATKWLKMSKKDKQNGMRKNRLKTRS